MSGLALGVIGLWVILQTTYGPLATKIGLLTSSTAGSGFGGTSTIPPGQQGNPSGIGVIQPTPAPAGQSGTFGTDQNGDLYKNVGGQWVPWGTTAPGNQPGLA